MMLELLSPAKNLDFGREAINHGADALYIGAPAFGARKAATNSIEDIELLVKYAHLYGSRVFVTVNTLLFDNEIEDAVRMIYRLHDVGVDALIIQDLGLLECDLPPIELHASTQCHNASIERIKFMESVGFRRVILARETSLEQMRAIRAATHVDLESFVHGALCVSYSGQCYMSQYLVGRSGNRGQCSQPCRSRYDLYDDKGKLLLKDRHLLSLKDFSAAEQLLNMVDAGITSFKIEGRLKDISYVKNVTAYYRQLLDSMMSGTEFRPVSSGHCTFYFVPDIERTFNRGYTDYFLRQRQPMASFGTQKALGKQIGTVTKILGNGLVISGKEKLVPGDGLCYFDSEGMLQGFQINRINGDVLIPNAMPSVAVGTQIWRNHDHAFEKVLEGHSAERRINVRMLFRTTDVGFSLVMEDEDGVVVSVSIDAPHEEANHRDRMSQQITKQLGKLGDTPFAVESIKDETEGQFFLTMAVLNQLRRMAVDELTAHRIRKFHPLPCSRTDIGEHYPAEHLDYRANIVNHQAEAFYKNHGINEMERGVEQTEAYEGKALMTTKYCLRYELGCCLQGKNPGAPKVEIKPSDALRLYNNGRWFDLRFDCSECVMRVVKH